MDCAGSTVVKENTRGVTEVVWTYTVEIWLVYCEKDAEDGIANKDEPGKA